VTIESAPPHEVAPPEGPPEDEGNPPRWPAWYAPLAFFSALIALLIAFAVAGVIAAAAGHDLPANGTAIQVIGTLVQELFLVGAAVFFASRVARPRAWHFGLRSAPFWKTVGAAAAALVAFYAFAAVYQTALHPHGQQDVAKDLGANKGEFELVVAAILVVVVAPAAEEVFFRGFFYRALRTRFTMLSAALIDAVVFGAIHYTGPKTLSVLPVLAVLGFIFCVLYERTGSLFPCIALHALNNAIAYSASVDNSVAVALPLGVAVVLGCAALLARVRGPAPALR